jgi:hypothetical protein
MMDQSLIAEVLGFWMFGLSDGGEVRLTRMYENLKAATIEELPPEDDVVDLLLQTAALAEEFANEPIVQRPHLLMMIAAFMYARSVLPIETDVPLSLDGVPAPNELLNDWADASQQLSVLNAALSGEETRYLTDEFVRARTTTHRMKSRQVRFRYFCQALAGGLPTG